MSDLINRLTDRLRNGRHVAEDDSVLLAEITTLEERLAERNQELADLETELAATKAAVKTEEKEADTYSRLSHADAALLQELIIAGAIDHSKLSETTQNRLSERLKVLTTK